MLYNADTQTIIEILDGYDDAPYPPHDIKTLEFYDGAVGPREALRPVTPARPNENIERQDLVAWPTIGFHHVPMAEAWPVMPAKVDEIF